MGWNYTKSIILGLGIGSLVLLLTPNMSSNWLPRFFSVARAPEGYANAIERSAESVVGIRVSLLNEEAPAEEQSNNGSGIIVRSDGYVITNFHVIMSLLEHKGLIAVELRNGRSYYARVVGYDRKTDVAVLKIDSDYTFTPIIVNLDRRLHLGDIVLAIGNPYNLGQTVTHGIVSAVGRSGSGITNFSTLDLTAGLQDLIQTDAPINSGNSGGALVNTLGEFVGMSTATLANSDKAAYGISFAIPKELVLRVMNDIIKNGKVVRGFLGITATDVGDLMRRTGKLNSDLTGIVITAVDAAGPSYGHLEAGDIVININGQRVMNLKSAMELIADSAPGTRISFDIIRAGQSLKAEVEVSEQPAY